MSLLSLLGLMFLFLLEICEIFSQNFLPLCPLLYLYMETYCPVLSYLPLMGKYFSFFLCILLLNLKVPDIVLSTFHGFSSLAHTPLSNKWYLNFTEDKTEVARTPVPKAQGHTGWNLHLKRRSLTLKPIVFKCHTKTWNFFANVETYFLPLYLQFVFVIDGIGNFILLHSKIRNKC